MNIERNLPKVVLKAINILEENGYEAYITGGAIRDIVMGRIPKDYDITTSAFPDEIKDVFYTYKTIDTGIKYGTVTVIIDKEPLEITTFRIDGKYLNNRKPESVSFSRKLCDDLSRRDFTVNAMAYSQVKGFTDLFGGQDDIKNKTLRAIGNADIRFKEDALRILRALRFSSELGFEIEEETHNAILKNKSLLRLIAKERIRVEFNRILMGECADEVIYKYPDIIKVFISDAGFKNQFRDIFKNSPKDLETRLCIFLLHFTCSDSFSKILKGLKFDNKTIKNVLLITEKYKEGFTPDRILIKKALNVLGEENFDKLMEIFIAEKKTLGKEINSELMCKEIKNDIISNNICFRIKDLSVNGFDLLSAGIPQKYIGKVIDYIFSDVLEEKIKNEKSVLLKHAEEFFKNIKN